MSPTAIAAFPARYFRDALDRTPHATLIHHGGRVIYANDALAELLRHPGSEAVVGRHVLELVHQDHRAPVADRVDRIYRGAAEVPLLEQQLVGRYGQAVAAAVRAHRVEVDGEAFGVTFVREARAQHADDEARAVERMARLGLLTLAIANEVTGPLAASVTRGARARAMVSDLRARTGDAATADELDRIELESAARDEAAQHALDIARDLARLAERDADRYAPVSLQAAAQQALRLIGHTLHGRAVLEASFDDAPVVLGDQRRLTQILVDLLLEAGRAIADDDPSRQRIELRVWREGARACALIRSTGADLPPATLARMFDPFATSDRPGLGLAITHELVTSMRGSINVSTRPGQGTTFTVRFPALIG